MKWEWRDASNYHNITHCLYGTVGELIAYTLHVHHVSKQHEAHIITDFLNLGEFLTAEQAKIMIENCKEIYE